MTDILDVLSLPARPFKDLAHVPRDPAEALVVGDETPPRELGLEPAALASLARSVETLYRTRLYPALQICIRRHGAVVLHRAYGYAAGAGPADPHDGPRRPITLDTPFCLYSASKAVTAMVMHKLDEQHLVHLDDRVCEYIPEFARHRKEWITLRHVLCHRAGIPGIPEEAMDLDRLAHPEEVVELLCDARPESRAGRRLAYHAISGGFVLGEVVRRVTGSDPRDVLRKQVIEPLGFRWMNYGVRPEDVSRVARDAPTGLPVLPPFTWLFRRVLGTGFREAVHLASDPRFLTGVVPSANVVSNAEELCRWYQCLLDEGEVGGVRVYDARTVRRARAEQAYWEIDFTLGLPIRYGMGFMLGGNPAGLFGPHTPKAFGHLGFTNIVSWADPERALAVALLTSGKPFLGLDVVRLLQLEVEIDRAFPRLS